jgi:hypothetical protein
MNYIQFSSVKIIVSGRVHGVGYRYYVAQTTIKNKIITSNCFLVFAVFVRFWLKGIFKLVSK